MVRDLVEDHGIACDLKSGTLHADHKPHYAEDSKAYVEKLNCEYGYEHIRYVNKAEVEEMVGSTAYYGGMVDMFAGHLHPLNYALGLGAAARKAGATFFENREVQTIEKGSTITIKCEDGPGQSQASDHRLQRLYRKSGAQGCRSSDADEQLHHRHRTAG